MTDRELFIEYINEFIQYRDELNQCRTFINIDNGVFTHCYKMFDLYVNSTFTVNGADTIYWWLFDKYVHPELKYFQDNIEISCNSIPDLWELVKNEKKEKNTL